LATEEGVVIRTDSNSAWVKTVRSRACEGCSAKGSCHASAGSSEMEVKAFNEIGAKTGDRILLRIETGSMLKVTFLIYVFPILLLIIGAAIGWETASYFDFNPSALAAILGFSFFAAALMLIKVAGNKLAQKNEYRPKIAKILK
jgi:sigma-E factor negative regulatory protein RseC